MPHDHKDRHIKIGKTSNESLNMTCLSEDIRFVEMRKYKHEVLT